MELYTYEVWNKRRLDLVDDLVADEVVRHGVDEVVTLTRAEARRRVERIWSGRRALEFVLTVVVVEGDLVSTVWQCDYVTLTGEGRSVSGIEVFRVVDGRICEVWNNAYQQGVWL